MPKQNIKLFDAYIVCSILSQLSKKERIYDYIEEFNKQSLKILEDMSENAALAQWPMVLKLNHRLKGSAGMLGALAIQVSTDSIRTKCDGKYFTEAQSEINQLNEILDSTILSLKLYVKKMS